MTTRGCVYLASGRVYNDAARWSIETLRETGYADGICVFTDDPDGYPGDVETRPLGKSVTHPGDSILDERHIMYDKNLYTDSDVVWCRDPSSVFELLDSYDLLVQTGGASSGGDGPRPDAFPGVSATAFAYTRTRDVRELFEAWARRRADYTTRMNRHAFADVIYTSGISFAPLGTNFMTHIKSHHIVGGEVTAVHYQDLASPLVEQYLSIIDSTLKGRYVRIEGGEITFQSGDRSKNMHTFGAYVAMMRRDLARVVDKIRARFKWD